MMIRPATVADIGAIFALIDHYASRQQMLSHSKDDIAKWINEFVIATDGSGIIGCGAFEIMTAEYCELKCVAVREDAHGKGIGSRIVESLETLARSLGLKRIYALTYEPGFYSKIGYSAISRSDLPHDIWHEGMHSPDDDHPWRTKAVLRRLEAEVRP